MKPVPLEMLGSEIVFNNLHDTLSSDWLDEDLVFARMADGSKVEVGWYGEPNAGGFFKIVLFKTSWSNPERIVRTADITEVVEILKQLSFGAILRTMLQPSSCSASEYQSVPYRPLTLSVQAVA